MFMRKVAAFFISLLVRLRSTILEALFPIPEAEREVLSMGADRAWKLLPRAKSFPIREACSIFAYKDERVWRLIWAVKYKKSARAAEIAGYALWRILRVYSEATRSFNGQIIVVPMPITRKRRRERGYNQCELIVDALEKLVAKENECAGRIIIVRDLLLRTRHKSRQTMKDRTERLESARDIFAVNKEAAKRTFERLGKFSSAGQESPANINKRQHLVIVIDDVVTTGSTIRDAIMTLRAAGFANSWGLSVAH